MMMQCCCTCFDCCTHSVLFLLQVILQIHTKANNLPRIICKWQNFMGKDGLNAWILPSLPIRWGIGNEFFFKTISTATFNITRKTVFALRFPTDTDADEFHMWWLNLNGQIKVWLKEAPCVKHGNMLNEDKTFTDVSNTSTLQLVSINRAVLDEGKYGKRTNKKKHLRDLVSPKKVSGLGGESPFVVPHHSHHQADVSKSLTQLHLITGMTRKLKTGHVLLMNLLSHLLEMFLYLLQICQLKRVWRPFL